jgi:hypothetical protein
MHYYQEIRSHGCGRAQKQGGMTMYEVLESCVNRDLLNNYNERYVKNLNIRLKVYDDSMYITDLTNALKTGKTCTRYIIRMDELSSNSFAYDFVNWLDDWSFEEFIKALKTNGSFRTVHVSKTEIKGINVFSPFVSLKPIKQPRKWTLTHIWKAILSGQIKKAYKTMHLTDDYAFDAANNFGKGKISAMELAKDLIESPSGWWVSDGEEKDGCIPIGVHCHHYDYNVVYFEVGEDNCHEKIA